MVRLFWTCCLFAFAVQTAVAATVSTAVDRDHIRPGESVVVTYTVGGQVPEPDFSPLERDFEILHRGQSRDITVAGGDARIETAWKLVLEPRRRGELSLPGIRFGDDLSESRTITVAEPAAGDDGNGGVRIEYEVDDPTPYVNQQLVLTVKVYTADGVEDLQITRPEVSRGRARVDRLGGVRRYETVRGSRRYQVHEQRYTLVPGAAGMLRLSPVEVRGRIDGTALNERSAPLELEVLRARASGPGLDDDVAPDDLFLEVEVDQPSPYVQEQVLYTVRVFRAVTIENATLSKPAVSGGDAVIERVGDDRDYQVTRDERRYAVTERRFAVFPQTSGAITIEPVQLSAAVPLPAAGRSGTGFWNRPLTRAMQVESDATALSVKGPPEGASSPWLPARRVTLEEEWPDPDAIEVGTPITRRIAVNAEGLLASQLPELDVPLPPGLRSYPERPRRETRGGEDGVSGTLEQTMAIIPAQAGTLTVPALELAWWNTGEDRAETLRLPARALEVTASAAPPAGGASPESAADGWWWSSRTAWWLSLGLALAWLATLVLWWRDRRRAAAAGSATRGGTGGASRRRIEARLRDACRAGDPRAARDAMLDWGRARWPHEPPRSLGALGGATNEAVADELAALQQALYAPDAGDWRGDGLYRAVASFDPERNRRDRAPNALKPLYGH